MRKKYPTFRKSTSSDFRFFDVENKVSLAYTINDRIVVCLNSEKSQPLNIDLPNGNWTQIVNSEIVDLDGIQQWVGQTSIPPLSGAVFIKN